jgi:hypothetical protein
MSTTSPPVSVPPRRHLPETIDEMCTRTGPAERWVWHGFLATGSVTLLTSQWKAGKTTLLSVLLARMAAGGTLAGLTVSTGRAVVVSEEAPQHWRPRHERLQIGPHVRILSRPFRGRPTLIEWQQLIDEMASLPDGPPDLFVVDTLASFLPARTENVAACVLDMFEPLQQLLHAGTSVLVLHHPRKGQSAEGQAARGSGALAGQADIVMEMSCPGRAAEADRRRQILGFSRHAETPRGLIIELTADGKDYVSRGDIAIDEFKSGWEVLFGVLDEADRKKTRKEILYLWPDDHPKPDPATLWRWLDRAVVDERVLCAGRGRRNDPFVFWLPGKEEEWANDPFRLPDLPPLDDLFRTTFKRDKP